METNQPLKTYDLLAYPRVRRKRELEKVLDELVVDRRSSAIQTMRMDARSMVDLEGAR